MCQRVWSLYGVWPLTASMEVKNKHAYVITQEICNIFIEVIFWGDVWFHGQIICCNVRLPCRLLVRHLFFCLTCLFSQLWFLWRKKGIFHLKFWIAVSQPYASQIYLEKPYPSRNSIITWAKHNSYIPLFNFDAYFMLEELHLKCSWPISRD